MRERYQHPGAPYELSMETKADLQLVEPSQWTLAKLLEAQTKVSEPLLLYWWVLIHTSQIILSLDANACFNISPIVTTISLHVYYYIMKSTYPIDYLSRPTYFSH